MGLRGVMHLFNYVLNLIASHVARFVVSRSWTRPAGPWATATRARGPPAGVQFVDKALTFGAAGLVESAVDDLQIRDHLAADHCRVHAAFSSS